MDILKCAASILPNLTGKYIENVRKILEKYGFKFKKFTKGRYEIWCHSDRSQIQIRPNGEITRRGGKKVKSKEGKLYYPRFNQDGVKIYITENHNTGEFVSIRRIKNAD